MTALVVYVTAENKAEALQIGRALVRERLVACANVIDGMTSIYWWEDQVEQSPEALLIAKTTDAHAEAVIRRVKELHSYDCPCVTTWPIAAANPDYLDWIEKETR